MVRCRHSLLALICTLLLACDRNVEPYVPGEPVRAPNLSKIFPEGAERVGQGDAAPPSAGAGMSQRGREATASPISGTITLAPELADRVPPGSVLFLIARAGSAGPPLAVQRIPAPRFPMDFEIGPDDRMIASVPFLGDLQLSVRVDADGNATTRIPGDLQGVALARVQPGTTGVAILIDEVL